MNKQNIVDKSNNNYNSHNYINESTNNNNNNTDNNNNHSKNNNDNSGSNDNKRMKLDRVKQDSFVSMNESCTKELLNTTETDCSNVQNLIINLVNPNNYESIDWGLLKDHKNLTSLTIKSDYLLSEECIYDISYWLTNSNIYLKELYIQVFVTNHLKSYNNTNQNYYLLSLISLLFPQLNQLKIHYYKHTNIHDKTSDRLLKLINPNPQTYDLQSKTASSLDMGVILRKAFKLYSTNSCTMNKQQFINYYCFVNDYKTINDWNDVYAYHFIYSTFHPGYTIDNNNHNNNNGLHQLKEILNKQSSVTIQLQLFRAFYRYYLICNYWPSLTEVKEIENVGPNLKPIIPNRLRTMLKQFYKLGYNRLLRPIKPALDVDSTNTSNKHNNATNNINEPFYDLYYKYYGENKDYFEPTESSPISFAGLFNLKSLDIKFLFVKEEHEHYITLLYKSIQSLPKLKTLTIDVNYFLQNGGKLEQFNILIGNPNINELNIEYEYDLLDSPQQRWILVDMNYELYNAIYRTNNWYNISGNLIKLNYDSILQAGLFVLLNGCNNLQELCVNVSRFKSYSKDDYAEKFTGPVSVIYSKYDYSIFHCYDNFFGPYNFILLLYNLLPTKLNKLIMKNWHLCIKTNEIKLSNRLYNLLQRVETASLYEDNNDFIQFEFSPNTILLHTFIAMAEGRQSISNNDNNNSHNNTSNNSFSPNNNNWGSKLNNHITVIFHVQDLMQVVCHFLNSRELVNMAKSNNELYKFISSNKLCWTYCKEYFLSSLNEKDSWLANNIRPKIVRNNIQSIGINSENGPNPLLSLFQTIIIPQYNQIIKLQIYGKDLRHIQNPMRDNDNENLIKLFWELFGNNFPLLQQFEMITTLSPFDFYLPCFKLAFKNKFRNKLTSLILSCIRIGDEHIKILSDNCPNLTNLNLSMQETFYEGDPVAIMFKSPESLKMSLAKFTHLTQLSFSFEQWSVGLNFYPIICNTLGNQLIDLSLTFRFLCVYGRNQQELNYFSSLRVINTFTIKFIEHCGEVVNENTANETADITNEELIWYFPKFSSSLQYINLYFERHSANIHEFEYTNLNYILNNCIDYSTIKNINYCFKSNDIPLLNQKQIYSILLNIIISNNQLLTISLLEDCDNNIKHILESAIKLYSIKIMDKNPKSIAINHQQLNYLLIYCMQNNLSS